MHHEIVLENAHAKVGILPTHGAATSRYEYRAGSVFRPLLTGPDGRASLIMAPWQNRISGGGFLFEGRFVSLERNSALDPLPLHGSAWLMPWTIAGSGEDQIVLRLVSERPEPYRYQAQATFKLARDGSFETVLRVTNTGERLPFGLGLHPNFTRTGGLRLYAPASTVTLQDAHHLPSETLPTPAVPDLNFDVPKGIPEGPINNEFGGWIGRSQISWPEWDLACDVECPGITRYLLHTPGKDASFLSFEPVTHSVDAFSRPDPIGLGGLTVLGRGDGLEMKMICRPFRP
jgi:aldose 1-epimerase